MEINIDIKERKDYMKYPEYTNLVKNVPYTDTLEYKFAIMWLHPDILPLGVCSVGEVQSGIVKIPGEIVNRYGRTVPVIAIGSGAFVKREDITDIILPSGIQRIAQGAFFGCINLKRITIPKNIKRISEATFAGCNNLEDIYYEGTMDDWKKLEIVHQKHEIEFGKLIPGTPVYEVKSESQIHIPGNDALLTANIHFQCKLSQLGSKKLFKISSKGKDITDCFSTII